MTLRRIRSIFLTAVATAVLGTLATPTPAVNFYWDTNGTAPGAGVTPSGTWGVDPYWSTSFAGTLATANTVTTSLDTLIFSAGTDAPNSPAIAVSGTQNALLLNFEESAPTFSGGTINLGAGGGIVFSAAGNLTISSNLNIAGQQTFTVGNGRTVALDTGTFTRAAASTLNVTSSVPNHGTLSSTMMNLGVADLQNDIIGPWATIGASSSSRYVTIDGSNRIVSYTGTTAATPADLADTPTVNYELAATSGTSPSVVSANTIRFSGSSGTTTLGATSFTVNGLMSVSFGWTFGLDATQNLTIGSNRELVLTDVIGTVIAASIQDNPAGESGFTKTGPGTTQIQGTNTYTGVTTINQGTLSLSASGSLADTGAVVVNGGKFQLNMTAGSETIGSIASLPNSTINLTSNNLITGGNNASTTVAGNITTTSTGGSLTKQGTGTMTLSGANTYDGGTIVNAGTLSVNNTAGSATGEGTVIVNSDGTLSGSGAVSGQVNVSAGGTIAPGNSIGTLKTGNLMFTVPTSNLAMELDFNAMSSDLVDVTGAVTLINSTLALQFLNGGSLTTPLTFIIVQNDSNDEVTGAFGIITNPIGFAANVNYAYTGTDAASRVGNGNDIAVTISSLSAVPEAGTVVMCMLGIACAAGAAKLETRRQKRRARSN